MVPPPEIRHFHKVWSFLVPTLKNDTILVQFDTYMSVSTIKNIDRGTRLYNLHKRFSHSKTDYRFAGVNLHTRKHFYTLGCLMHVKSE